ncbi:homeobox protein engrailed-2-B-like isoform X1 [Vespa mandarinia]|uniref:homeobox protein engrailed-2-B-like isoform X1 n=2 Tax=Vespa mandarinia TaxID=7446 RepID=UPI00161B4403|nr:homeobox protein engrailed-2-B-like isoform X1 [Vespa mandarinia]XP_035733244.1 homeobox protein engrailed-2-B-like isoform X1 [Vespa mandarinia]
MNSFQRSRSEKSDFSIARILSEDNDKDNVMSRDSNNRVNVVHQFYQSQNITETIIHRDITKVSNLEDTRFFNSKQCQRRTIDQDSLDKMINEEDGTNEIQETAQSRSINAYEDGKHEIDVSYGETQRNELAWLQYTRYRPPKLPRRSLIGRSAKRRPGVHPRIPFSSFQLQILEERYKKNAYLSRRDALDISMSLRLPQSRVKIWFQNRRARDRRESNNVMAVT